MNKKYLYPLLIAAVALTTGCENWLDKTSDSEIRGEEHYSTIAGFQQTLTGCYIGMTDTSLYGEDASWLYPELMARQFSPYVTYSSSEYYMQHYLYEQTSSKEIIDGIWAKAYNVIANANDALSYIDAKAEMLGNINYSIIKGELLAVRAYLHFDLMRLYGYGNWANRKAEIDAKMAVPYVTTVDKNITPQVTTAEFFRQLTADLDEAASLLREEDPITGNHDWSYYEDVNADGYYNWRNLHLNYYAVRALQARVYLWEGSESSKQLALEAAEEVINNFLDHSGTIGLYNVWRWMDSSDAATYPALALEQLFAVKTTSLATNVGNYYIVDYTSNDKNNALFITPERMSEIYEDSPTDWRAQSALLAQTQSGESGYVSKKLIQPNSSSNVNYYYGNRVPLIRLPELYYIAAECYATSATPDLALALERLNTVREHRGLYDALAGLSADEIVTEIGKEYRKEFLAEGVMFYYYKRLGIKQIPDYDEEMTDAQYVIPYPDFETQSGRVQ